MKVYIVMAIEGYEGSRTVAVYLSKISAEKRVARLANERKRWQIALGEDTCITNDQFSEFVTYSSFQIETLALHK